MLTTIGTATGICFPSTKIVARCEAAGWLRLTHRSFESPLVWPEVFDVILIEYAARLLACGDSLEQ
jgi:hypothetical protein